MWISSSITIGNRAKIDTPCSFRKGREKEKRMRSLAEVIQGYGWSRIISRKYFWGYKAVSCFRIMNSIPTYILWSFITHLVAGLTTSHPVVIVIWRSSGSTACHKWTGKTCISNEEGQEKHYKFNPSGRITNMIPKSPHKKNISLTKMAKRELSNLGGHKQKHS